MRPWLVLSSLAFRRVLPWPLLLLAILALAVAVQPGADLPASVAVESEGLGRMLARARVWIVTAVVVGLVCIPRAAIAGAAARASEGDLVSASAIPRAIDVSATWLGTVAGGLILILVGALAAELAAGGNAPALSLAAEFPNPSIRLVENHGAQWKLPQDELLAQAAIHPGSRLVLDAIALPGAGPATVFTARVDADREAGQAVSTLLRGRARLELPLGQGSQRNLIVQRDERGAFAVVPPKHVALYRPTPFGERSASLRLVGTGALALVAVCALALALGTWLQAWLASLGSLALVLGASLLELRPLPGTRIATLFSGDVPQGLGLFEALSLTTITLVSLGLAASVRGRRRTA